MWGLRAGNSMVKSMHITGRRCDAALTGIKIKYDISSQKGKITPHLWLSKKQHSRQALKGENALER